MSLERRLGRRSFIRDVAAGLATGSQSPFQVLETLAKSQPIPVRLRPVTQAVEAHEARRKPFFLDLPPLPDLSKTIYRTHPRETLVELANGHFNPEWNFRFPLNPVAHPEKYPLWYNVDGQRFIAFTNTDRHRPLRNNEDKTMVMRDLYDGAMWAIHRQGVRATAIIELDHDPDTLKELPRIVETLDAIGIDDITIGNEHTNPFATYRNNPLWYVKAGWALRKWLTSHGGLQKDLSLPPLVYYRDPQSSLEQLLQYFADEPGTRVFPFTTAKFNFYGPVDKLIPTIYSLRKTMDNNGAKQLKLALSELGFPGGDRREEHFPDEILASCYLPQTMCLAAGSKMLDTVGVYSFFDGGNDYFSLARWTDQGWKAKPTYQAFNFIGRLLGNMRDISITTENGYVAVQGGRRDGIHFMALWSEDVRTKLRKPTHVTQVDALGRLIEDDMITLYPPPDSVLGGPIRILLWKE